MILTRKKYFNSLSWFVLVINICFLAAASFHTHHLRYISKPVFSEPVAISYFEEPAQCLFSQINKPTYFYLNTEYSSINFYSMEIIAAIPGTELPQSQTIYSLPSLRAPPASL
jgi:hypothetical protein